tara:strand:- start:348 stop:1931 length:1584 start_codon:yes stop_codon:yes gene_type:complete
MFNLNFYKKKFRKLLLSINRIIESFFAELSRSKYPKNKREPIKKKITYLDQKIESFFDQFRELKKYNQNKKRFNIFENKKALVFVVIFLLISSYFILPSFYNKDEIKILLKNQISNKHKIDLEFNEKINYSLLPTPFFYTKNLNILHEEKILGNSNYAKFYVSPANFFSLEKIKIQDLVFKDSEFEINANNLSFFKKALKNSKSINEVFFKNSKFFYRDEENELLFLSKIDILKFFYDETNELKKIKSFFEVFNIPFKLDLSQNINDQSNYLKLMSKKIRLNVESSIKQSKTEIDGIFDVEVLNKSNSFKYLIKNDILNFISKDKNFSGQLNFKPFYFSSDLNFNYVSRKKILKDDTLIIDLLDSELLNNPNLNAIINVSIDKIDKFEYLTDFVLEIQLADRRIFMSNFDADWNESLSIKSSDIEFVNNKNGKKLIGEIAFNFNDVEKFFRYFQIKRNYRNVFKQIKTDFIYDFSEHKLILNNLKIDNVSNRMIEDLLDQYNKENQNLLNKVIFRNFVKKFFQTYAG